MATLRWISVLPIFFIGAVLTPSCTSLRYVGCYHLLRLPQAEHPNLKLKIHTCVDRCSERNSSYAAYKTPLCHCVFNLTQLRPLDLDSCTFSCVDDPSLRCGGMSAASLYFVDHLDNSSTITSTTISLQASDMLWLVLASVLILLMAIITTTLISWSEVNNVI